MPDIIHLKETEERQIKRAWAVVTSRLVREFIQ